MTNPRPTPPGPDVSGGDPVHRALVDSFGFNEFHVGQREVIDTVLAGQPTLAVMPTGAGKSLCYQLPALLLDGVTIVVSPLIALMKDQVDALQARGIMAGFLNSSLPSDAQYEVIEDLAAGRYRLLYVAPERFRHQAFVRALRNGRTALFAIDEAHCISRWGHDFRPDYLRLGEVLADLEPPRVIACTATATAEVRDDIIGSLGIQSPAVHVAGFLRSNLFLEARMCGGDADREKRLISYFGQQAESEGAHILYASTRKRVERFGQTLAEALGREAVVQYHAGMSDYERTVSQERFMAGEARVAVATNAFGMGVDRADVRGVVHLDLPRSVEGYYQEVGRAGRDGRPAYCLLLFNNNDTRVHEFLIEHNHPTREQVERVWSLLQSVSSEVPVPLWSLAAAVTGRDRPKDAEPAVRLLTRIDAVMPIGGPNGISAVRRAPTAPPDLDALGLDFDGVASHASAELNKLRLMKRLAFHPGCRHAFVLDYFGEAFDRECPGCDRCHGSRSGGIPAGPAGEPSEEEATVVRKALAGVARSEARFGLRKVGAMLAGSRSKDLARTSLPNLSTFGVLKGLGIEGCVEVLHLLVDRSLCTMVGSEYPRLEISKVGWAVMVGKQPVPFRLPVHLVPGTTPQKRVRALRDPRSKRPAEIPDSMGSVDTVSPETRGAVTSTDGSPHVSPNSPLPADASTSCGSTSDDAADLSDALVAADPLEVDLAEALREFRHDEAKRAGVPLYVVFHNRTLDALAHAPPSDQASFVAIHGLGPAKWGQFGPRLIEFLADYLANA